MNLAFLALGSNLNCPTRQIYVAIQTLQGLPHSQIIGQGALYKNPAWGRKSQPQFVNTVIAVLTRLTPEKLLSACLDIEVTLGRVRGVKNSSRTIDIDLLWYEGRSMKTPTLTIPHPMMYQRDFVTTPLRTLLLSSTNKDLYQRFLNPEHISFYQTTHKNVQKVALQDA